MKKAILIILALALCIMASSPALSSQPQKQTVRIAAFNFYPAIFKAADGSVQGFYVDFMNEIAKQEGWNIEYVYGSWAEGLQRIKTGEVDLLTNAAFTEERATYMDYAREPLLTVWSELYVHEDSKIDSILHIKDKRIGLMKGDFNAANFRNLVEKFGIKCTYVEYDNFEEIFKAVASKKIDGGVVNNTYGSAKFYEYSLRSSGVVFNPFEIYLTAAKGKHRQILATFDRYLHQWRKTENSPFHIARERWAHGSAATIHITPAWVKRAVLVSALLISASVIFILLLRRQVRLKTTEIQMQLDERQKIEEMLIFVNETGAKLRGDKLLGAITAYLASSFQVEYAFVGELMPGQSRVKTHGLFANGAKADDLEYDLKDTPCENVVAGSFCFYESSVVQAFPKDITLARMGAEAYAAVPLRDSLGRAIGLLGIISKRRLSSQKLTETLIKLAATRSAQELEAMNNLRQLEMVNFTFENISDAVYWISSNSRIWNVNSRACTMLGYTREELLELTVADLDPKFPKDRWQAQWQSIREIGSKVFESIHRTKDGKEIPVEITATYFSYNGIEYHCALARDISQRKQLEEELHHAQKMESIGRLAGGIAHDFNNMLSVILGYSELAKMKLPADSQLYQELCEISKAAGRSRDITRQLLAFSRKELVTPRPLDINEAITNCSGSLVRLIGEHIKLETDLCEGPAIVMIDPSQLDQILINLAVNARDAMPEGGTLMIGTKKISFSGHHHNIELPAGSYLQLVVRDNGIGMDRQTCENIFEPFYTTKGIGNGTGLGLATVYGIVKQNNGFIKVSSEPGQGSTFTITLPLQNDLQPLETTQQPTVTPQIKGHVLLVEDEEAVRQMTASMLKLIGLEVTEAASAEEALKLVKGSQQKFDLILTDMVMPGMNGLQLGACLTELIPKTKLVYMSGYAPEDSSESSLNRDEIDLLQKPFDINTLSEKIRLVMGG